jgi:hypothetical protein
MLLCFDSFTNTAHFMFVALHELNFLFTKFTRDNKVIVEFHLGELVVKDRATWKVLLRGRCWDGLYSIGLASFSASLHLCMFLSV